MLIAKTFLGIWLWSTLAWGAERSPFLFGEDTRPAGVSFPVVLQYLEDLVVGLERLGAKQLSHFYQMQTAQIQAAIAKRADRRATPQEITLSTDLLKQGHQAAHFLDWMIGRENRGLYQDPHTLERYKISPALDQEAATLMQEIQKTQTGPPAC